MKNKKVIISIITGVLVIGVGFGLTSQKDKAEKIDFDISTLDVATVDGKDVVESELEEIGEEETPAAAGVIGGTTSTSSVRNLNSAELETIRNDLIAEVNKERKTGAANKLVSENVKLESTGNIRAKEIVTVWSHTRPNGTSWETVLTSNGISTTNLKAGEDLAKITATAKADYSDSYIDQLSDAIHASLMNSPTHKAVILNQNYSEIGIGMYSEIKDGKVTVYVTEHFKNTATTPTAVSKLTIKGVPSTKVYTGKQIKPAITVYNGSKKLTANTDYTVSYGTNKSTGKATIKVTGKGNYSGSKTVTFYITPSAPTSVKLTGAKKALKVSYKKATGASGYQIAYSTKKTSGFKTVTTTAASKTISKLSAKKTYYVKVRAYKTVSGKKYYSSYTAVKSVKTK